jgi:hypothetical protein
MSDELAPDAVGESHAAPTCQHPDCESPAHYREGTVCHEHLDYVADVDADEDAEPTALAEGGDPADFTVVEVHEYLQGDITDEERVRIIEAESAGKGRSGIIGHG